MKHAKAKNVLLHLYYNEDHMEATIKDDGVGFQLPTQNENGPPNHHSGLSNIRKRIQQINGSCIINSLPGKGTTINFHIPYLKK